MITLMIMEAQKMLSLAQVLAAECSLVMVLILVEKPFWNVSG